MGTEQYSNFHYVAQEYMKNHPHFRKGQAFMESLACIDFDIYMKIMNTDADPFYDDSKIPAFDRKFAELAGINTSL
jgi:hypothetical protein